MKPTPHSTLATYCYTLADEFSQIPDERKAVLQQLSRYVQEKNSQQQTASLVAICTHNSRRSHFSQCWLQTAAVHYGIDHIRTYSGGTEATAFHPNAVEALRRTGLTVHTIEEKRNSVYKISLSADQPAWQAYSKRFDNPANPTANFCAVMVCTDADQNCPLVPGAEKRIALPYQDPKTYDNTLEETQQYDHCCRQIAREMFYMMVTSTTHLKGRSV